MNSFTFSMMVSALFFLQACSSQPAQPEVADTVKTDNVKTQIISSSAELDTRKDLITPEAQIIRELYHSGCLIEKFELNRHKQQLKITCADDKPLSSSL